MSARGIGRSGRNQGDAEQPHRDDREVVPLNVDVPDAARYAADRPDPDGRYAAEPDAAVDASLRRGEVLGQLVRIHEARKFTGSLLHRCGRGNRCRCAGAKEVRPPGTDPFDLYIGE